MTENANPFPTNQTCTRAHWPRPVSQPLMRDIELKEPMRVYSESEEHGQKKNIGAPQKAKRKLRSKTGGNAKKGSLININADFSPVTLVAY